MNNSIAKETAHLIFLDDCKIIYAVKLILVKLVTKGNLGFLQKAGY